ncbi:hypothetical protein Tco_0242615 [Tanacetum coccineum]
MLDMTDYESWQQRIRHCPEKDNGENIMKSINEGPFQMGTVIETINRSAEGAPQLGPERDRVFTDLIQEEKERHIARQCPQPKRPHDSDYFKDKMLLMQAQENGAVLDEEKLLFLAGEQVTNFDDDVDDPPEQDLALNVDHVFEADQCDAFDSDVDEAPTT